MVPKTLGTLHSQSACLLLVGSLLALADEIFCQKLQFTEGRTLAYQSIIYFGNLALMTISGYRVE